MRYFVDDLLATMDTEKTLKLTIMNHKITFLRLKPHLGDRTSSESVYFAYTIVSYIKYHVHNMISIVVKTFSLSEQVSLCEFGNTYN